MLDKLFLIVHTQSMKSITKSFVDLSNKLSFLAFGFFVNAQQDVVRVDSGPNGLGFEIPSLSILLTFLIRFFFVLAGLSALLYLLWGSLDWIMSGGEKEKVQKAREKIMNALIGVIVIVATLSLIWTLEQVVFKEAICFGISCDMKLPVLLKKT